MTESEQSRTRKKKADRELRELGDALTALSPENLERMDLPEVLRSAVAFYHQIPTLSARRRQWKTLGALLRRMDRAPIQAALENVQRGDRVRARRHHRIEQWRDALKSGNLDVIEEILGACPAAERQRLSQLARNAVKEAVAGSGVKASRALFRYLNDILGEAA